MENDHTLSQSSHASAMSYCAGKRWQVDFSVDSSVWRELLIFANFDQSIYWEY